MYDVQKEETILMGSDHLVRLHVAKSKERRQYSWKGDSDHDVQVAKRTLGGVQRKKTRLTLRMAQLTWPDYNVQVAKSKERRQDSLRG